MPPWCESCQRFHRVGYWLCLGKPMNETKEDKNMAVVETKTVTRKEMREVEVEEKVVTLNLNEQQAEVVTAILMKADGATFDRYDLYRVCYGLMEALPNYNNNVRVGVNSLGVLRAMPRDEWTK